MFSPLILRDISGILSGLAKEFNIDQFLVVLLESLLAYRLVMFYLFIENFSYLKKLNLFFYSDSDDVCHHILLSMIKTVPIEAFISPIVLRLLATHKNLSQGKFNLVLTELGFAFCTSFNPYINAYFLQCSCRTAICFPAARSVKI